MDAPCCQTRRAPASVALCAGFRRDFCRIVSGFLAIVSDSLPNRSTVSARSRGTLCVVAPDNVRGRVAHSAWPRHGPSVAMSHSSRRCTRPPVPSCETRRAAAGGGKRHQFAVVTAPCPGTSGVGIQCISGRDAPLVPLRRIRVIAALSDTSARVIHIARLRCTLFVVAPDSSRSRAAPPRRPRYGNCVMETQHCPSQAARGKRLSQAQHAVASQSKCAQVRAGTCRYRRVRPVAPRRSPERLAAHRDRETHPMRRCCSPSPQGSHRKPSRPLSICISPRLAFTISAIRDPVGFHSVFARLAPPTRKNFPR